MSAQQANEVLVRFYDTHLHGRRGEMKKVLLKTAAPFICGAALEPNTNPHVLTCADAQREVDEATEIAPKVRWLSSIYLTAEPNRKEILQAWNRRLITHVKRYPPHGSTHSGDSVSPELMLDRNSAVGKCLCMMEGEGIPLKNHGEVVEWKGEELDPYDRERVYFAEVQPRLDDAYPNLRQILAHISSAEAAAYMRKHGEPAKRVCEVTPHHLGGDRRWLFDGGYAVVDHHCLPPIKRVRHMLALQDFVRWCLTNRRFIVMAGSDAAGHSTRAKYTLCAYGGLFLYHCALQLYLQVLDEMGLLHCADMLLYGNAKHFHEDLVPDNAKVVRLIRAEWTVDKRVRFPGGRMTPFGYHDDPEKRFKFQWMLTKNA